MPFDPSMTYWQSLRIVARGLIQWPLHRYEAREIAEALKDAVLYSSVPFARLLALILLPISAPLFTLLVQMDRRKTAKDIAAKKAEMRAAANAVWSATRPTNSERTE